MTSIFSNFQTIATLVTPGAQIPTATSKLIILEMQMIILLYEYRREK